MLTINGSILSRRVVDYLVISIMLEVGPWYKEGENVSDIIYSQSYDKSEDFLSKDADMISCEHFASFQTREFHRILQDVDIFPDKDCI